MEAYDRPRALPYGERSPVHRSRQSKMYRNAVIARIVRVTLDALDLTYPSEMPDLDRLQIK